MAKKYYIRERNLNAYNVDQPLQNGHNVHISLKIEENCNFRNSIQLEDMQRYTIF